MSLDGVCERAQASRSQLYHYFDDRADLVRAVVRATAEAVLSAQAAHLEGLDSWAAIEAWFDELVSFQEGDGACRGCRLARWLANSLSETIGRASRWRRHLIVGRAT